MITRIHASLLFTVVLCATSAGCPQERPAPVRAVPEAPSPVVPEDAQPTVDVEQLKAADATPTDLAVAEISQEEYVTLCSIKITEDDEYGPEADVGISVSRRISKQAARDLAEKAVRIAKRHLEPESPPQETIGPGKLKYTVVVMPVDPSGTIDIRAFGTKPALAEEIEWKEIDL